MRDPPAKPVEEPACVTNLVVPSLDLLAGVGGGLVTMVLAGVGFEADGDEGDDLLKASAGIGAGATLFLVSAVTGFNRARRCERAVVAWGGGPEAPPPMPEPLVERVAAKDPRASQLTRAAHDAASQHRCGPARAVARSVQVFDGDYYERVFLANATIARCL